MFYTETPSASLPRNSAEAVPCATPPTPSSAMQAAAVNGALQEHDLRNCPRCHGLPTNGSIY
jgi:hypothetical protein